MVFATLVRASADSVGGKDVSCVNERSFVMLYYRTISLVGRKTVKQINQLNKLHLYFNSPLVVVSRSVLLPLHFVLLDIVFAL